MQNFLATVGQCTKDVDRLLRRRTASTAGLTPLYL